ncbi:alcohol dehydrogenase [Xylona heveae TC161]|uniref:Alcohol dehydrogenase n=1 Tax=Xylona heveae (strain CBS 132557 / TC161) TaxID=1328760 RepID=A0A164ZEA1_XYLHT|nr:alcohol dehydrogenase [Xylona heveae TC161]KZF18991.1 alcohol dehydrogenase [Xylona heveae TC161]
MYTVFKGSYTGVIIKEELTIPELQQDEVLVKITHSGLCATDELFRNDPVALGHEGNTKISIGAGHAIALGPDVRTVEIGDAVAFGLQHSSCGSCAQCLSGNDNYCPLRRLQGFDDPDLGSFSTHAIVKASFLFRIEGPMDLRHAAPLICAGATVFGPMCVYDVRPEHRVGIIGFGGLGHLAVQFAAKVGCEVVVFSRTDAKKKEAMEMGATEFVVTQIERSLEILEGRKRGIDHLFLTSSVLVDDWDFLLNLLNPGGAVHLLTASPGSDLVMPYTTIVRQGLKIQGSLIAPRHAVRKMLDFALWHSIRPVVQEWPMTIEGITEAMETLKLGKVRYRAVLVNDT